VRRQTQRRAHAPGWLSVLVVLGMVWVPAAVAGAGGSHPAGVSEVCREILRGKSTGDLTKETEPADGSTVRPGDEITVKLVWDRQEFSGHSLHKVVDCVTIDGVFDAKASTMERPTENDGEFRTTHRVPEDADEGARLCERGFASGGGGKDNFERHKSNDVCFMVGPHDEGDHGGAGESGSDSGPGKDSGQGPGQGPGKDSGQGRGKDSDQSSPPDSEGNHQERKPEISPPAGDQSTPPSGEQVPTPTARNIVTPRPDRPLRPVRRPETAPRLPRTGHPVPSLARTGPSVRSLVLSAGFAFVFGGAAFLVPVRRRRAGI
jgi:hypothetical protein